MTPSSAITPLSQRTPPKLHEAPPPHAFPRHNAGITALYGVRYEVSKKCHSWPAVREPREVVNWFQNRRFYEKSTELRL